MVPVEPDVTFRRLAQILGIRPVVHDAVMLVVAARVGGGPPDDGRVVVGRFELRRFGDLDVLGSLLRRRDLSDAEVEKSSPLAAAVIASFTISLFIEQTPIGVP